MPQVLPVSARLHGESRDGIGLFLFSLKAPLQLGTLLPLTATNFCIDGSGDLNYGGFGVTTHPNTSRTVGAVLEAFRTKIPFDC
jgi:hypothetical protein